MSAAILQLQEDLVTLKLDPGPVDGLSGSRTRGATHTAAQRFGLSDFTGKEIPSTLIQEIHALAEKHRLPLVLPTRYLDLSEDSAAGWREGYRPITDIDALTLHQTGCPLPDVSQAEFDYYVKNQEFSKQKTPALLRWAKHQTQIQPPRYQALKTHFGITYSGTILQIHPLEQWGWSAQSFSKRSFSIEIAGFFEGVDGQISTKPGGPSSWKIQKATAAQIAAAKELIRYLYRYLHRFGLGLKFLLAHRQATDDRDPDPGSWVWQEIVLPMLKELNLSDGGPLYVKGKGHPLPDIWTKEKRGVSF